MVATALHLDRYDAHICHLLALLGRCGLLHALLLGLRMHRMMHRWRLWWRIVLVVLVVRMRLPGRRRRVADVVVALVHEMVRIGKHGGWCCESCVKIGIKRGRVSVRVGEREDESIVAVVTTVRGRKSDRDRGLHAALRAGRTVLSGGAVVGRRCKRRSSDGRLYRRLFDLYRYDTFLRGRRTMKVHRINHVLEELCRRV